VIETSKYVRRPIYVDAVQVTEENFAEMAIWCQGQIRPNDDADPIEQITDLLAIDPKTQHIHVRVHNPKNIRQTKAFVGDWLLYTERGYKVYTTKAFKAAFDLAEAPGKVNAVTKQA
jgi:hypothetical protein